MKLKSASKQKQDNFSTRRFTIIPNALNACFTAQISNTHNCTAGFQANQITPPNMQKARRGELSIHYNQFHQ
jgi:hypothetical protein